MERVSTAPATLNRQTPVWRRLLDTALRLDSSYRSRRMLADLPAHLRRDIGMSDDQVVGETRRPVWDAAEHMIRR